MPSLTLGNQTFATQNDAADPVIASNVRFPAGMVVKVDRIDIDPVDFSGGAYIPRDATPPTITEGGQVIQKNYVPKLPQNQSYLLIQAHFWMGELSNSQNRFGSALFINDSCVAASVKGSSESNSDTINFTPFTYLFYHLHNGSTVDIEIRADNNNGASVNPSTISGSFNATYTSGSTAFGGGLAKSQLVIWEISL